MSRSLPAISRRESRPRRGAGFTLIEMLLAISIFSIVIVAANSILFGALRLRNRTADLLARTRVLEHALTAIRNDFAGLVIPTGKLSGSLQSDSDGLDSGKGRPVSPELYTNTGLIDDRTRWAEVQKVAYFLRTPTNSVNRASGGMAPSQYGILRNPSNTRAGLDLVRSVSRNLLPPNQEEAEDQVLLDGVDRMTLTYFDGSQWRSSWNSTNETSVLPKAIKVEILLASDASSGGANSSRDNFPLQLVVPVSVTADTNQTASTGGLQ